MVTLSMLQMAAELHCKLKLRTGLVAREDECLEGSGESHYEMSGVAGHVQRHRSDAQTCRHYGRKRKLSHNLRRHD